jgi:RHS repeat-associated protein
VSYQYVTDAGSAWYALTENKILFDPEDPSAMSTMVVVDGLGRAAFTAKAGETRAGSSRRYGWNASGFRAYDAKGRPVAEGQNRFIENGDPTNIGVDVAALLTADYSALTRQTTTEYDILDRPITVTLPDGAASSMEYGIAQGAAYTVAVDPLKNRSRREVDARGNVRFEGRYDKDGKVLTSARYEYSALGELLVAYDHQGNPLTVEYDLAGRRTAIETKDSGRKEYHYDAADNLVRETDNVLRGRGESIAYEYDGMNRLLTINYPRSADTVYTYGDPGASDNRAGRVKTVTDESGTITYTYGSLGETTSEMRSIIRQTPGEEWYPEKALMQYEGDYLGRMQRIIYPDDEVVTYGYDRGGEIKSVTGVREGHTFNYVVDVAYDEYGQRSYIEYGNGVRTAYVYDENRRWLSSIATAYEGNGNRLEYQNIVYTFDAVGNVLGYENKTNRYETSQTYTYDGLYQLRTANGRTVNRSEGVGSCPSYTSTYAQTFDFDDIGNMTKKVSTSAVSPKRTIGAGLNYNYDRYDYYAGYPHRLERVGNLYYRYDGNGNVVAEREGGHAATNSRNATVYNDGDLYYTDYGFGLFEDSGTDTKTYERRYTWNERNLLASSVDRQYAVSYRYGADGQRAVKYAVRGSSSTETMYFNQFWTSRTTTTSALLESKHIFVGTTRVVTKLHQKGDDSVDYEGKNRYYYHSDHLGSAQLVTDFEGREYERIEYTPYGELWVEKTKAAAEKLPFRFTGKEFDEETGLYYYGARYLDPKYSRWISCDPALLSYVSGSTAGGGIYNSINFNFYHYGGNNPVRYSDPTGLFDWDTNTIQEGDTLSQIAQDCNTRYGTNYTAEDLQGLNSDTISDVDKIYAGNHLNLGKAEDVQKRAADYTSRATTQYSNEQVSPLTNKTYQIGLGIGVFAVIAASFEVGICYSEKDGFDIYRTIGGGCGVGITGDITFSTNYSDFGAKSIHRSTGSTTQIGVGPLLNYAMPSGKFSGIGGIGVGGGTLWTYTRTVKGDIRDFVSLFRKKD